MEIERKHILGTPIWISRAPEFEPYAAEMERWIRDEWQKGSFTRHKYGYGYQTPNSLFTPDMLEGNPALQALKAAFRGRVMEILKQRVNQSVKFPPEVYAFTAWVLVQTNEEWVSGPWHDHYPALVSGCYYLTMPETKTEGEGALMFMRPGTPDAFGAWMDYVKPARGDLIMFPSNIMHRPAPSPSATDIRVSINMDAYVHWGHWNEEGRPEPGTEEWMARLRATLPPEG